MLMGDPRHRAQMESASQARIAAREAARNDARRFVTFALGGIRFALDSSQVKEIVMPDHVYSFPHTMLSLEGVLVRRGMAIPVCNVVRAFGEGGPPPQHAKGTPDKPEVGLLGRNSGRAGNPGPCSRYVIAQCSYRGALHSVAIPVSGDCELVQGEPEDSEELLPEVTSVTFVAGLLRTASGTVPLLDMDQVVAHCIEVQSGKEARQ